MSAIERLRDGFTAGASDPSAAHDEFDRLVRLAGLDADHAAALEREAIAAWLASIEEWNIHQGDYTRTSGEYLAEQIRNGAHHKGAR